MHPSNTKQAGIVEAAKESRLHFKYLPALASWLLNRIDEYIIVSIKFSREEDVPILKLFAAYTDEQLIEIGRESNREQLTYLANNEVLTLIEKGIENYVNNRIPMLDQNDIVTEDITVGAYVRRRTFNHFIALYTNDPEVAACTRDEVDRYATYTELRSYDAYIEIQKEKLRAANQSLAQSEEQLLEAQELAKMGSFVWNFSGGKSVFTPGVMKVFGMSETSNLDAFLEFVHEDDRYMLKDAIDKSMFNDGVFDCEYRLTRNGKEKKIWSRGLVTFEAGKPLYMKGTVMDVTDKEHMIGKLRESESISKKAEAITHIGNWIWDIEANTITWSDEMYRIYGLEPQSKTITFDYWFSLIYPEDREMRRQNISDALRTLHANDYEIHIATPDGNTKVLKGRGEVITDRNSKPIRLLGTCQDITLEYNLKEELLEKEEYLQQLIRHAPDAVIVIDGEGIITLWNPKTEEIFGWAASEVTGKYLSDVIIPPQYREAHIKGMQRLRETGVARILNNTLELTALNKKGKEFYVSITISQSVQQGKAMYIAFLRDITNEKQIKAELQNKTMQLEKVNVSLGIKNIELERTNKELESFNFVASHDLQEPLRKIQIFANRILDKGKQSLPNDIADYFEKIRASSQRMQTLIEDLLTFSQTTANENNFAQADLNEILDEARNVLSQSIEEKHAVIEAGHLPVLRVIPFQVQQLFVNLISNGLKYARENVPPVIHIKASRAKGEQVDKSLAGKNYIEISFEDNGIGFSPEHTEKIFGLFQRLHSKEKYSGTGIGLAICKKIMNNHDGFIHATSQPDVGSVFSVYFPVVLNEAPLVNLA